MNFNTKSDGTISIGSFGYAGPVTNSQLDRWVRMVVCFKMSIQELAHKTWDHGVSIERVGASFRRLKCMAIGIYALILIIALLIGRFV